MEFRGDIFMLGEFKNIGGNAIQGVARWDGLMWVPVGEGPLKSCQAGVVFDDGSGPALYCAGTLNVSEGTPAAVLRWNGSSWSNVGGVLNGGFSTLAVLDLGNGPTLYAGGTQSTAENGSPIGCVAFWTGAAWQPVGNGFIGVSPGNPPAVLALEAHDDGTGRRLYAGGIMLKNAAGELVNNVAVLVDGQWQPVGGGVSLGNPSTQVSTLLSVPDDASGEPSLYVGGLFSYAGTVPDFPVKSVARWSAGSWHEVPIPGVGGTYTIVRSIARMAPAPGAPERLYVIGVLNSSTGLFMAYQERGIWFEHPGRISTTSGGDMWSAMVVPQSGGGARMIGCGSFTQIDGCWMKCITIWDGSRWLPFGEGLNAAILTSVVFDDGQGGGPALYVGGIANAGLGETFSYVAKWTGSGWQKLGLGLNGTVSSLAVYDSGNGPRLVAAGSFTKSGTTTVGSVAQWDGAQWSKLGSAAAPITNSYGLVAFADQAGSGTTSLYAMGNVSTQYKLARFNGTSWQVVSELTATNLGRAVVWNDGTGDALWIGGFAMKINGVTAGSLVKFDGTNWSWPAQQPLGAVWAMTVLQQPKQSSSQLVLGGGILLSGPTQASRVVSFDGASFTPFQDGFDSNCAALTTIYSPAFDQNVVVAGGAFTTSNGMPVNGVATYTGTEWRALGGGTSGKFPTGGVTGVAMLRAVPASGVAPGESGETLLVGGGFTQTPSGDAGLARWNMCACPADLNHDGQVDGTDMGMLLSSWGPCRGCDADLNGDGQVNGTDLGLLLGEWTG
ncbi:MAG: dockerin type I domain-containing protein [Phycisphaerales bacterium]